MNYKNELEIDLLDLLKRLLKKWYVLGACAVVLALAAAAFSYVRSGKTQPAPSATAVTSQINTLKSALSEDDALITEAAAEIYKTEMAYYHDLLNDAKTSALMKLNPASAYKESAVFSVTDASKDSSSDPSESIASPVGVLIDSELRANAEEIAKKAGTLTSDDILKILIVKTDSSNTVTVSFYSNDKDEASAVINAAVAIADKAASKAKETFGYDVKLAGTYSTFGFDKAVSDLQYAYTSNLSTVLATAKSVSSTLTKEQTDYFNYLIAHTDGSPDDVIVETNTDPTPVKRSVSKKYILLGFLGGGFLAVMYYSLRYIFSSRLRTSDDVNTLFGLSVIGTVNKANIEKGIEMLAAELALDINKKNAKSVSIIGSSTTDASDSFKAKLGSLIKEKCSGTDIKVIKNVLGLESDMKLLSDSEYAVLVEQTDVSKYEDVASELELCKKYEVNTLGSIVIK